MSDAAHTAIAPEDRWAFLKVASLIARIRYDDQGYGHIHLRLQDGVITTVEQLSILKPSVEKSYEAP